MIIIIIVVLKRGKLCKSEGIKLINGQTIKEADEIMTMNKELRPRSDAARIYLSRKKGGRGLISCESCVRREENNLSWYVRNSEKELLRKVGQYLIPLGTFNLKHVKLTLFRPRFCHSCFINVANRVLQKRKGLLQKLVKKKTIFKVYMQVTVSKIYNLY